MTILFPFFPLVFFLLCSQVYRAGTRTRAMEERRRRSTSPTAADGKRVEAADETGVSSPEGGTVRLVCLLVLCCPSTPSPESAVGLE